jgi:hypothetical protein
MVRDSLKFRKHKLLNCQSRFVPMASRTIIKMNWRAFQNDRECRCLRSSDRCLPDTEIEDEVCHCELSVHGVHTGPVNITLMSSPADRRAYNVLRRCACLMPPRLPLLS